jgi:hypothetical protein
VGRVDAHLFPDEAACGVERAVKGEELAFDQRGSPLDDQEYDACGQAPQRLVQEGRMKRRELGVANRASRRVDLESPRKARGSAEEFLVEVVAPPADRLGDEERRRDRIGEVSQVEFPAL